MSHQTPAADGSSEAMITKFASVRKKASFISCEVLAAHTNCSTKGKVAS